MMLKIYRELGYSTKIGMKLFKLLFSGNMNKIGLVDLLEYYRLNWFEGHVVQRLGEQIKFCLVRTGELFLIFLKPVVSEDESIRSVLHF